MIKKVLTTFFLMLTSFFVFFSWQSFAATIKYVYKSDTSIMSGVEYSSYDIFMSDRRWVKAYVATADLNHEHLSLEVMADKRGVGYLSTVSNIAKSYDTTVAINSDFFAWGSESGRGSPIGEIFFENKMLSSPSSNGKMYSILQDKSGRVFSDTIDYKVYVKAPDGQIDEIGGINKVSDLSKIMIYDKGFAQYSSGSTETKYEVVVRNNKIDEIRFSKEPVELGDNMYIIAGLSDWDSFMLDHFSIGDEVILETESNIDFSSIKLAAGAGAKIVSEGKRANSYSHVISGNNPRSAFGISEDGKKVYMAVIDGRSIASSGMSMDEEADFMLYIGSYTAVNLDGGGSSAFVAKNLTTNTQELINAPSEGSERKVSSVIAVTSSALPTGKLDRLKLSFDGENVFKNSRIKLSVKGFDGFGYPAETGEISYSVSGVEGYFEGDTFFPTSSGTAVITAYCGSVSASESIRVLDKPYKIEHEKNEINIDVGEKQDIRLFIRDENGYIAHVPLCDTIVTFSDDIAHTDSTAVYADRSGSSLMSISFGDAVAYIALYAGKNTSSVTLPADKTAPDTKYASPISDDTFAVFGKVRESDTLFNNLIMKKSMSEINQNAKKAFILSMNPTDNLSHMLTVAKYTCYPYSSFTENGSKFIILDTEDYFMSAKEWEWFIDEVETTYENNIFVFMQTELSFSVKKETTLLKDILKDSAQKGKNVFVFSIGDESCAKIEDGVRYITTPGFSDDINASGFEFTRSKLSYVTIDASYGSDVRYKFNSVY